MKKKLKCLFALHFILLVLFLQFSSCKRENLAQTKINELTIEQAKSWYVQNVRAKNEGIYTSDFQGLKQRTSIRLMQRLDKFIKWASFHEYKTIKGNFILVDIDDTNIVFAKSITGNRKLVFYLDSFGNIRMNIIESLSRAKANISIGEYENIINYYFRIGNSSFHLDEKSLFIYDMQYIKLAGLKIINGKAETSRNNIKKQQDRIFSLDRVADEGNCQLWGVYLVRRDEYGNIIEEELLYTYYVGDCGGNGDPEEEQMPGDYGGGGDIYIELTETDNLTDPCLVAAKQAITNAGLGNYLYKLYSAAYLNPGTLNISWNQNSGLGNQLPAQTTIQNNTWVMQFNNSYFSMNGSSQQFVASVMLHEIIHTLLLQNNIVGGNPNNWTNHTEMFSAWTNHMRDALIESFGMDQQSATGLALGGISDALAGSLDPNISTSAHQSFMNNFSMSYYNISLQTAFNIQDGHRRGNLGTPCN